MNLHKCKLRFTNHANQRMSERSISENYILEILEKGQVYPSWKISLMEISYKGKKVIVRPNHIVVIITVMRHH